MFDFKLFDGCRRRCFNAVAAVRGVEELERIIPIAFPVYQSTWKIKLRVEQSTGLVDRHILKAVRQFGPISASGIGALLGLKDGVIERALSELSNAGVELRHEGLNWSLADNDVDLQHFYVEQVHDFSFVSNGLTGDFLPLTQTKLLKSAVLARDQISYPGLWQLKHIVSSSDGELTKKIVASDRAHRFAGYGIPDGYVGFAHSKPEKETAAYMLAFMFVYTGETVNVVAASESAVQLECPKKLVAKYLAKLKGAKGESVSYEGIKYSDFGNLRKLEVRNPALWADGSMPDDEQSKSMRLLRNMTHPGWMCDSECAFHRLVPGDADTAYHLAIMRGCSLLRRCYSKIRRDEDIVEIAAEYHDECNRDLSAFQKLPPFAEVIKFAVDSQDGNVAEVARRYVRNAKAVSNVGERSVRFISSKGSLFCKSLVDAIDTARRSIMIMSPVLNEDEIFEALERARTRGVRDICVITPLTGRRSNVFKTDPLFNDYELPRQKLAALGASVRDCSHTVHAKLIVVDTAWSFVTTANLNANSLGVGKTNAVEVALEYHDVAVAKACEAMFWEVWGSACYRQVRVDDRISIMSNSQARMIGLSSCIRTVFGCTFLLSTPENQLLARKLSALIASAKKYVDIISMSFYDLEEIPCLYCELIGAMKRGVRIRVCVRPGEEMNFRPEDWPDPSTQKLLKAGLELYVCDHLHAKGIVVDGKSVLMTSANFNQFSLGCSSTSHIEIAVFGTVDCKPLSQFAQFVSRIIGDSSQLSRQ